VYETSHDAFVSANRWQSIKSESTKDNVQTAHTQLDSSGSLQTIFPRIQKHATELLIMQTHLPTPWQFQHTMRRLD
jgi:hypothetical protein